MLAMTAQNSPVEIIGADKIHPKLGDIVRKMLLLHDSNHKTNDDDPVMPDYRHVNKIFFDDMDYPRNLHGSWMNREITVNIRQCWKTAQAQSEEFTEISAIALAWHFVLRCVFHELFHAWAENPNVANPEDEIEEEEAELFSEDQMVLMAMLFDVEMPDVADLGCLTELFHEAIDEHLKSDPTSTWAQTQQEMFDNGEIYHEDYLVIKSYREFVRRISDNMKDPRWDEKPAAVSATNVAPAPPKRAEESPKRPSSPPKPSSPAGPPPPPPEGRSSQPQPSSPVSAPTPPVAPRPTTPAPAPPAEGPRGTVSDEMEYGEGMVEPDDEAYVQADKKETYHAYTSPMAYSGAPQKAVNATQEEIISTMQAIYMRLARHLFEKCGWDGHGNFVNPAAVLEAVYIGDLPHAEELIISCNTTDSMGKWTNRKVTQHISGLVFTKSGLPAYSLLVNIGGKSCKRILVPQNSKKSSPSAERARNGERIVWLINGDMTDRDVEKARAAGRRASKFIAKISNDTYTVLK